MQRIKFREFDYSHYARRVIKRGVTCLTAAALIAGTMADVALASFNESTTSIPSSASAMIMGSASAVTIDGQSRTEQWLTFTPTNSGKYTFVSDGSGDPYGSLYEVSGGELVRIVSNDDGGNGRNFRFTTELDAGKSYYLACSDYNDDSTSYTVVVNPYDEFDLSNYYVSVSDINRGTTVDKESLNLHVYEQNFNHDYDQEEKELVYGSDYIISGYYVYDYDVEVDSNKLDGPPTEIGEYYVEVTATGQYHGSIKEYFRILDVYDIYNCPFDISNIEYGTIPSAETLGLTFYTRDTNYYLVYDRDYEIANWYSNNNATHELTLLQSAPTQPGEYYVEVEGIGSYHGTRTINFSIYSDTENNQSGNSDTSTNYNTGNNPGRQVTPAGTLVNTYTGITAPVSSAVSAPATSAGQKYTVGDVVYKVISPTAKTVSYTKCAKKKAKSVKVPATVQISGESYKVTEVSAGAFSGAAATSVKVGKSVTKIAKGAFKGSKVTTVRLANTAKPTKKMYVKGCFSGSKVQSVKVPKKQKAAYKKLLTKAYTGTKASKLSVK